jgi:hypothetical protein
MAWTIYLAEPVGRFVDAILLSTLARADLSVSNSACHSVYAAVWLSVAVRDDSAWLQTFDGILKVDPTQAGR